MWLQHLHDRGDASPHPDARGGQALQVHRVRLLLHPARAARPPHGKARQRRRQAVRLLRRTIRLQG